MHVFFSNERRYLSAEHPAKESRRSAWRLRPPSPPLPGPNSIGKCLTSGGIVLMLYKVKCDDPIILVFWMEWNVASWSNLPRQKHSGRQSALNGCRRRLADYYYCPFNCNLDITFTGNCRPERFPSTENTNSESNGRSSNRIRTDQCWLFPPLFFLFLPK